MDQIQSVKSELRLQHWAKIIAECQASTQTVKAWCEANDIHIKTYCYWLRKLRQRTLDSMPACQNSNLATAPAETPLTFRPLEVESPVSGMKAAVIVHLPQATLEVASGTDQRTLEAVLLALRSTC